MQGYGERIREICLYFYKLEVSNISKRGYIKYMSDKLKIKYQSMYNYIREIQFPRLRILKKIEKLGVNINWLIMGQGEMFSTVREIPRYKMSILLEDSHEKIKIPLGDMYKHNFTNLSELSNDIFIKLKL